MPIRAIDRPLTLLEDHFGLLPEVLATRQNDVAWVGLFLGAGYGISDDFEVGLKLIRLTLSKDPASGIDGPTGYVEYRLLDGALELSVMAELEVPVNETIDFRAAVPILIHGAPILSLRLEPNVFGFIAAPGSIGVELPADLRVQLGDRFGISLYAAMSWPSLRVSRAALLQFGGGFAYTVTRANAALAEIRVAAFGNSIAFGDDATLIRPLGSDYSAFIDATIFLRSDPDESFPDSPF